MVTRFLIWLKSNNSGVGTDVAFDLTILYVYQLLMKRKLFISTLLAVFLFSSTGFPLSLHICGVNGLSSASSCKMHKVMKKVHNCCSKEEETSVNLTQNDLNTCCQFKVIERNLSDQIVYAGNDINTKTGVKSLLTGIAPSYQSPSFSESFTFSSNTSPPATGIPLYLNISVLLI